MILDKLKLVLAALIVAVGVSGFYYFGDRSDLLRVPGLLLVCVLAIVVALQTEPGGRARDFTKGAIRELRQVVWPTRKETTQVTLVVVALVIVVALYLWVVDLGLQKAIQLLVNPGS
ncbi:MAG: preprotein translocase subunit SecE [Acidiferrobacterales bacterium]